MTVALNFSKSKMLICSCIILAGEYWQMNMPSSANLAVSVCQDATPGVMALDRAELSLPTPSSTVS